MASSTASTATTDFTFVMSATVEHQHDHLRLVDRDEGLTLDLVLHQGGARLRVAASRALFLTDEAPRVAQQAALPFRAPAPVDPVAGGSGDVRHQRAALTEEPVEQGRLPGVGDTEEGHDGAADGGWDGRTGHGLVRASFGV